MCCVRGGEGEGDNGESDMGMTVADRGIRPGSDGDGETVIVAEPCSIVTARGS